jgi:hypothetical protein
MIINLSDVCSTGASALRLAGVPTIEGSVAHKSFLLPFALANSWKLREGLAGVGTIGCGLRWPRLSTTIRATFDQRFGGFAGKFGRGPGGNRDFREVIRHE